MIRDATIPVVVYYHQDKVTKLLEELKYTGITRGFMRQLQPYLVSIPFYQQSKMPVRELSPGFLEWTGGYDPVRGLTETYGPLIA